MSEQIVKKLENVNDWDRTWPEIFNRYQGDLRHAYYIAAIRQRRERRLLEIAAGSFRDMAALNRMGVDCSGMDFSGEAVALAQQQFPMLAGRVHQMDASALQFPDKSFDLTYHNGFWVLFSPEEVRKFAMEQARVSRYRMVATVHNAHNPAFQDYFTRTARTDSLFNIRFLGVEEISEIMRPHCSRITVIPVGKGKKYHEDWLIKKGLGQPLLLRAYMAFSGMRLLEQSERLLCIGELAA